MFEKSYQFQIRIEKKWQRFKKKHEELLFFLLRMALYLYVADNLIKIPEHNLMNDLEYYFSLFEACNYLVILAIILLFPSLDDFRLIKN